jgi:hypothetical protein
LALKSSSGQGSSALKIPAVIEKARAPPPPNEMQAAIFFLQVFFYSCSLDKKKVVDSKKNLFGHF